MVVKPNGSEVLSGPECSRMLLSRSVGRVAVSLRALPSILPVAYAVMGDDLVFSARTGSSGQAELHRNVVAFEVDDIDPVTGAGWSVVAVGVARQLDRRRPDWRSALDMQTPPWAVAGTGDLFLLASKRISGRRYGAGFEIPPRPLDALV